MAASFISPPDHLTVVRLALASDHSRTEGGGFVVGHQIRVSRSAAERLPRGPRDGSIPSTRGDPKPPCVGHLSSNSCDQGKEHLSDFGMTRASLKSAGNLSTRLRKYCIPARTYSAWGGAIRQGRSVDEAYSRSGNPMELLRLWTAPNIAETRRRNVFA